jgi:hypothetical protein
MKLAITLSSVDLYSDELRYVKSYPLTYAGHILEIVYYHKQGIGHSICNLRVIEFDTDTMQVVSVHEYSCPVKKKIVINKSLKEAPAKTSKLTQTSINAVLDTLNSQGQEIAYFANQSVAPSFNPFLNVTTAVGGITS